MQETEILKKNEQSRGNGDKHKNDRILVIIPAYNEAGSICGVVDELIRDYPGLDYLVVTDGSKDGTPEICAEKGYHFLRLPVNLGLAGCFQAGMKYAEQNGYQYAVQFDGDGQHRPEYILPMQQKMQDGYDIVLGSRFLPLPEPHAKTGLPGKMAVSGAEVLETEQSCMASGSGAAGETSAAEQTGTTNEVRGMRSFGSFLIRRAIRLTTGVTVTDPTCGLRMYNRKMIDGFAQELNYAPEPDTISFLIKNGAKVAEVPVRVVEREAGQSYLKPLSAAHYMLKMLTSILFVQNFRA